MPYGLPGGFGKAELSVLSATHAQWPYKLTILLIPSKPSPILFSRKLLAAKQNETEILVTSFMKTQFFDSLSFLISLWYCWRIRKIGIF